MSCMKCARETEAGQVFCAECRAEMEKYPVKPGTVVQLPKRREVPVFKKVVSRRRVLTPSEQIMKLRRFVRIQAAMLLVCLLLIGGMLYLLLNPLTKETSLKPGQNYSSFSDTKGETVSNETEG